MMPEIEFVISKKVNESEAEITGYNINNWKAIKRILERRIKWFNQFWKPKQKLVLKRISELFFPWKNKKIIVYPVISIKTPYSHHKGPKGEGITLVLKHKDSDTPNIRTLIHELMHYNIDPNVFMTPKVHALHYLTAENLSKEIFRMNFKKPEPPEIINHFIKKIRKDFKNTYKNKTKFKTFLKKALKPGMAVVITGTPGTGKTETGKELSKLIADTKVIHVNEFIKKHKDVVSGYDTKRKSKIIDINKLKKVLEKEITEANKILIIESHLSHFLPKEFVSLCIVLRANPSVLEKRLEKRGYSKSKIKENIEAELVGICLSEALNQNHKLHEIDTSRKIAENTALEIKKIILKKIKNTYGSIDWSSYLVKKIGNKR